MEFTNKLSLPQYIVDWLIKDDYDHNFDPYVISATTLMKPTRANLLTLRHKDKLSQDVSDLISSRLGSAIHDSLEKVVTENVQKETRTEKMLSLGPVNYKITGKFDLLVKNPNDTYTLRDIKTTSVWAYIYGGKDEDYAQQLSIYRWLLSPEKTVTSVGFIDFFFTDWQSSKAKQDKQYPQQRVIPGYQIQLMSLEDTETYIRGRLAALEADRNKADDQLTPCTRKELWAGDEVFAVYKNGNQKASKLCDSMEAAEAYQREKNIVGFIERRPPIVKRCSYCSAFPFCNQGQSYFKQGLIA